MGTFFKLFVCFYLKKFILVVVTRTCEKCINILGTASRMNIKFHLQVQLQIVCLTPIQYD